MFKDIRIKSFYTTEDDFPKTFLQKVIPEAISYDRVSAYFTAESLSAYADGLENFGFKGHKYRLIVSKEVDAEDLKQIKEGKAIRESLSDEILNDLCAINSVVLEKNLSNLARLIALGILDVKIAFKPKGLFHDKYGILKDNQGNRIKFTGSNNETAAALTINHESFTVVCSWLDKDGFYTSGIDRSEAIFEKYWNGGYGDVIVREVDKVILKEILKHDKGKMIKEAVMLQENMCILDIDGGRLILHMNLPDYGEKLKEKGLIRTRLKCYQDEDSLKKRGMITFKKGLNYIQVKEIDKKLAERLPGEGYDYTLTERLQAWIKAKENYIEERSTLGLDIKRRDDRLQMRFVEFVSVVNDEMKRPLRDKQLWDAFFMTMMNKSGNFSVPGSGKTSSALGMFAFLQKIKGVDRILMIGTMNSFDSWKKEFVNCFGEKKELRVFDVHDIKFKDDGQKHYQVRYHAEKYNLFLFNYESIGKWEYELCKLAADPGTMLVFDEVHKLKNTEGKRAEIALRIAKEARCVIAMTGTPIPNGYIDIYNILHLLFPEEYQSFFGFSKYDLRAPYPRLIEDINRKLKPFYCRTTKEQLQVPAAAPDKYTHVSATPEQDRIFYILRQVYGRRNALAWFWRVLQLESDPKMLLEAIDIEELESVLDVDADSVENIGYKEYSQELIELVNAQPDLSPKMKACIHNLEMLVSQGKSVICWCIFRRSISSVKAELSKRGIKAESIDGRTEQNERQHIIDGFCQREFDVLITNPHTLAESVSLHSVCHDAVYLEYSFNLVHLLQSKDRIHRLGLEEGQYTQYQYMMTDFHYSGRTQSFDKGIYEALKAKEALMLEAINDDYLEEMSTQDEDLDMLFMEMFGEN